MRLSIAPFAYALVALAFTPYTLQTGFITAFTGQACDGDVGGNVTCDGSCHTFGARHSFRVRSSLPRADALLRAAVLKGIGCRSTRGQAPTA